METAYVFRGICGEIVRQFVRPRSLFQAVPTVIASFVFVIVFLFVAEEVIGLPAPIPYLVAQIAIAPILGGYAMAGRQGEFSGGVSLILANVGEVGPFIVRYVALTLAWSVVVYGGIFGLATQGVSMFGFGGMGLSPDGGVITGLLMGLAMLLLLILAVTMPLVTLLIATASDSVGEVFSAERFGWLLEERRDDLIPFVASGIGGMALFCLMCAPPLALLVIVVFTFDLQWGMVASGVAYVIPWGGAPILLGRMAGAFVAAETATVSHAPAPATVVDNQAAVRETFSLKRAVDDLRDRAAADPVTALAEGESLLNDHPKGAPLLALLAKLHADAGDQPMAAARASAAIEEALKVGLPDIALAGFAALGANRKGVKLAPADLDRLSRTLLNAGKIDDAVWCQMAALKGGAPSPKVEKGIVAAAEGAVRHGDKKKGAAVFAFFLKNFPDSDLTGYCQKEFKRLKNDVG